MDGREGKEDAQGRTPAAEQFTEKLGSSASGAKALAEKNVFIAALEALRHPKSSFSANCEAENSNNSLRHDWKSGPSRFEFALLFRSLCGQDAGESACAT
jgi:hypothetical protein